MKDILHQNTSKNLEPYFNFAFHVYFVFTKNLKFSKLQNFIHAKRKGGQKSILSGGNASSAQVLVSKTTFTHTLSFCSLLNTPTLKQWFPSHSGAGRASQVLMETLNSITSSLEFFCLSCII